MNIFELADSIGKRIVIDRHPKNNKRDEALFFFSIRCVWVTTNPPSRHSMDWNVRGRGPSVEEAIVDYVEKIKGKVLCLEPLKSYPFPTSVEQIELYEVPTDLTAK